MPEQIGRKSFLQFVAQRGILPAEAMQRISDGTREFREAPAAIALQHRLLDPSQVEQLLTGAAPEDGDIVTCAERLSWLTAETGSLLRRLQGLREFVTVCEVLLLEGLLAPAELDREMAAYFSNRHGKELKSEAGVGKDA